jgi:hypothetical protein
MLLSVFNILECLTFGSIMVNAVLLLSEMLVTAKLYCIFLVALLVIQTM